MTLRTILRYLLLILFTFLAFPFVFYKQPETGLDPSWNIAIHLAIKYDLIFGKDFVFTYGPLGFLCTRLPIAIPKIVYLLFDFFFLFNLLFVLNETFKKEMKIAVCLFLFALFVISAYEGAEQWYFFFYLFYLFSFLTQPNKIFYLVLASLLVIICFYIKLSLGIIALPTFVLTISFIAFQKRITWKRGGLILFFFFIALGISAYFLHVDLTGYILNSLQIINGYNDAMYLVGEPELIPFLHAGSAVMTAYLLLILFRLTKTLYHKAFVQQLDEFFIYGILALYFFVLFKNGFVRNDGHNYYFFRGILFAVALLFLFSPKGSARTFISIFCWITLFISLWAVNSLPGSFKPVTRIVSMSVFASKWREADKYFSDLSNYSVAPEIDSSFENEELKKTVGKSSVDVVPAEISQIYFNELRYNPRPVIQSYSAYNEFLDSLNQQKFKSENKPDYILFSAGSIDDRYPFFDEARTKLAILSNYRVEKSIVDQLVLAKKQMPARLVRGNTEIRSARLGKNITIPKSSSLQFTRIRVHYDTWGRIKRFFFRPPGLSITFTLTNGDSSTYRAVTTLLEGGVIINKFIDTNEEFELLMRAQGSLNTDIKKIRLHAPKGVRGFRESIQLITTHYWLNDSTPKSPSTEDSLGIEALYSKYKPTVLHEPCRISDSIQFRIESLKTHSRFIQITGWAFLENKNNTSGHNTVLLQSKDTIFEAVTVQKIRPDLLLYFQRNDLGRSGFSATVTTRSLRPGTYRIGIKIMDDKMNTTRISYSDHEVIIRKPPHIEKLGKINPGKEPKDLLYGIESVDEDDEQIRIAGWAAVMNKDSRKVTTSILLLSETEAYRISTEKISRTDVAEYFHDPLFAQSGFSSFINKAELPKGIYKVGIEETLKEKNQHLISISDRIIRIRFPDFFVPTPTGLPGLAEFPQGIDEAKDEKDYYTISGWAAPGQSDFNGHIIQVMLQSGKNTFICDTERRIRKDVTNYFKNQFNLDNCGFMVRIKKDVLPRGRYQVGIYLRHPNEKGGVQFINQFLVRD